MENIDPQLIPILFHGASLSQGTYSEGGEFLNIDVTQPYMPIEFNSQTVECEPNDCIQ
ncbi:hypothetical protein [Acinetobacter pittii]|uniref:hypothetical protein n=1 Tax=Acinetobacter pittii TaxID=48296 RepID=UPI001F1C69BC|nr:hypothetical protein [Acinetobacter pittii]MCE6238327.1 hypothetical protein [Acinetobacter pittii]MCE6689654.1 hypothetical protein [Acinetobacter pittii]MCE6697854.1 hypothetical protein [Acinetobacter pittii]